MTDIELLRNAADALHKDESAPKVTLPREDVRAMIDMVFALAGPVLSADKMRCKLPCHMKNSCKMDVETMGHCVINSCYQNVVRFENERN